MIGLPTSTISRMSSRETPASARSSAMSFVEAAADGARELRLAARVHHHVRDAAHQVLAEADLRVHLAGRGEHVAGREVAEVAGDRRRADVERDRRSTVVEARPDGRDRRPPSCTATVTRQVPGGAAPLCSAACSDVQRRGRAPSAPTRARGRRRRRPRSLGRRREVRLRDLDVVQADDRDRPRSGRASASLRTTWRCTWLSGGTSITSSPATRAVQPRRRPAREAAVARRRPARRRRCGSGATAAETIAVLGVLALAHLDLAAAADAAPAADRVEVDPEPPGRLEHGRAVREPTAPSPDGVKTTRRHRAIGRGHRGPRLSRAGRRRRPPSAASAAAGRASGSLLRGSRPRSSRRCRSSRRRP